MSKLHLPLVKMSCEEKNYLFETLNEAHEEINQMNMTLVEQSQFEGLNWYQNKFKDLAETAMDLSHGPFAKYFAKMCQVLHHAEKVANPNAHKKVQGILKDSEVILLNMGEALRGQKNHKSLERSIDIGLHKLDTLCRRELYSVVNSKVG